MGEFSLSLRWLPMVILAALLVIPTGCLALGEQSTPVSAVVNVSPEAMASLADPTSAPATTDPPLTATQPPGVSTTEPPVVSSEPSVEIAAATPCDTCPDKGQPIATDTPTLALPVAPVPGAQAPDFTLTDLSGDEVSLGELRGQAVLVNFWATW